MVSRYRSDNACITYYLKIKETTDSLAKAHPDYIRGKKLLKLKQEKSKKC